MRRLPRPTPLHPILLPEGSPAEKVGVTDCLGTLPHLVPSGAPPAWRAGWGRKPRGSSPPPDRRAGRRYQTVNLGHPGDLGHFL